MPTSREGIPDTLKRSPEKVQRTYAETLDSAHEEYGSEASAHRTAWAAVKHVAEKRGDHWELKDRKGPSDEQAMQSGRRAREAPKPTAGGVDVVHATKEELYERAKRLGVKGRSRMSKVELGRAIARKQ